MMKKWIFTTIFVGLSLAANAQYRGDLAFRPGFYIGANIGMNSYWGESYKTYMTFDAGKSLGFIGRAYVGFNFTPVIGLRGSYGYSRHNWPDTENNNVVTSFDARNVTLDMTVDITNWLEGYDNNLLFNFAVFGGVGAGYRYEFPAVPVLWTSIIRGGITGNFHLSKEVELNLTAESNIVRDEFNNFLKADTPIDAYPAITAGISYHFKAEKHKRYKKRR